MFPGYFDYWKEKTLFTDSIVGPASDYFSVKVFDVYDPRGASSAFLCDVVGADAVPNACKESLQLNSIGQVKHSNKSNSNEVQYDAIALAAASKGMVDMVKWKRTTVIDAIIHRHEEELGHDVLDFPLSCPEQKYLDEFWSISLDLDRLCMPEKFKEDPEHFNKLQEQFQRAIDKKKYCTVDVDAILEENDWKNFFQQFANPTE